MHDGSRLEERVLILAPGGRDAALAYSVLENAGFVCSVCASAEDLAVAIAEGAGLVLVAEEALGGSASTVVVDVLLRQPAWSDLPLLVFVFSKGSRETNQYLAKIASLGNVTFLERPIHKSTLVSAVSTALRARRRQYEVRSLLTQLESRVKERDAFLAILGHELRNPLGAILAATELMARRDSAAFERERGIIERQTRNLTRLVDDLLDVSRVTTGKIALQRAPVPLHDLLERSVGAARAGFRERGLELTLRVEQPPPAVSGDPVRLEQVVGNLLTNALKYTPAGGSVRVSLAREADEAVIRVKDTGVGIAPEVLPRVFDLFVQAEGTLDRAQGGMGIGLTLVRSLVELHGGSVSAASAGSDKGSEFTVRLPLLARGRTDASPGASEHPRSAHRRIVIVEDNADVRIPLEMLLSDLGHEVVGVEDGEVAVERIVSLKPELALVDIGLPHLDGYEVARRVRAALGDSVLLVALTGYGQPEDRRRALAAGFDAHMTKPIQIAALERMIAGVPAAFA